MLRAGDGTEKQQHQQSLLVLPTRSGIPCQLLDMGARQISPLYRYPSHPREGEEATASLTCPEKGQKLPGEGVQKVPGRQPQSRVSPNPAGGLPLPLLTGNTATSALQTSRGRSGQSCCCPASWKEKGRSERRGPGEGEEAAGLSRQGKPPHSALVLPQWEGAPSLLPCKLPWTPIPRRGAAPL